MWLRRPIGVILGLAGLAVLLFLSIALYTPNDQWVLVLVHLGMPVTLLGTLVGSGLVGVGVWLATHGSRHRVD